MVKLYMLYACRAVRLYQHCFQTDGHGKLTRIDFSSIHISRTRVHKCSCESYLYFSCATECGDSGARRRKSNVPLLTPENLNCATFARSDHVSFHAWLCDGGDAGGRKELTTVLNDGFLLFHVFQYISCTASTYVLGTVHQLESIKPIQICQTQKAIDRCYLFDSHLNWWNETTKCPSWNQ